MKFSCFTVLSGIVPGNTVSDEIRRAPVIGGI